VLISIFADFAPFLAGGVLVALVARRIRRTRWALLVPAWAIAIAFAWVSSTADYSGFRREMLVGLFAAAALVLPISIAISEQPATASTSHTSGRRVLVFLIFPLLPGVMMPWSGRVIWATKMAWSCDGVIVERYRSRNHQAPTLVVQNRDGTRSHLEGVSTAVWEKAAGQDRLRKDSGHADAQLNDQPVQLVLRNGW
jgi:hypothetical protein